MNKNEYGGHGVRRQEQSDIHLQVGEMCREVDTVYGTTRIWLVNNGDSDVEGLRTLPEIIGKILAKDHGFLSNPHDSE